MYIAHCYECKNFDCCNEDCHEFSEYHLIVRNEVKIVRVIYHFSVNMWSIKICCRQFFFLVLLGVLANVAIWPTFDGATGSRRKKRSSEGL